MASNLFYSFFFSSIITAKDFVYFVLESLSPIILLFLFGIPLYISSGRAVVLNPSLVLTAVSPATLSSNSIILSLLTASISLTVTLYITSSLISGFT